MEKNIANVLVEAAKQCDIEIHVHENYSGRGMMSRTTVGITYDSQPDLLRMIAKAAMNLVDGECSDPDGDPDGNDPMTRDEFIESLDFRTDSMGRSTIIY